MMENINKTTNDKVNIIIDVVEEMNKLKKNGDIQFVNYKWDEENNVFDITTVPKQAVEYIKVNFTLTPTGATFN